LVEDAGWYTFVTEWTDDGTSSTIVNTHSIKDSGGNLLFQGSAAGTANTSATGYLSGYVWAYHRSGVGVTLEMDNLGYVVTPVPEPSAHAALAGLAMLTSALVLRLRRKK
jgi:hypothetical protein